MGLTIPVYATNLQMSEVNSLIMMVLDGHENNTNLNVNNITFLNAVVFTPNQ